MIESIMVVCPSREERQHWIELLSQEQIASRASNLSRSPTSISHVSCCTHPPYTRLSRFFARLVRKRVIHPELLKRLLYFQYIFRPDLSSVKMRKCCLVTYTLFPSNRSVAVDTSPRPSKASLEGSMAAATARPVRKSSTLKLDVRYVMDTSQDASANCTSMAVFGSEPPTLMPEPTSRSLPPKVSSGEGSCCIVPNFDSVPYRELRSTENPLGHLDLSNLCDCSDDSKNWRSIGKRLQPSPKHQQLTGSGFGLRRAEFEASLGPSASPRSSDSGMADSFQYHSAELGSCYDAGKFCQSAGLHSESENDENKFENQCICTSPFGSTPRQSGNSSSEEDEQSSPSACKSLLSSRLGPSGKNDDSSEQDDDSENEDLEHCTCRPEVEEPEARFTKLTLMQQKHLTQPLGQLSLKPRQRRRPLGHHRIPAQQSQEEKIDDAGGGGGQIFTSGLYAHWWLKKTIPMTNDQGKLFHGMAAFYDIRLFFNSYFDYLTFLFLLERYTVNVFYCYYIVTLISHRVLRLF